jgi:TonB family protein
LADPRPQRSTAAGTFGALEKAGAAAARRGPVEIAQFETVVAAPAVPAGQSPNPAAGTTALAIVEKARAVYSDEARRLRIEGEVLLEVLFPASGPVRVLRVLRGLGHGLDERAIEAASAIRFRPAAEQGHPVNTVATVRIEFQLAL